MMIQSVRSEHLIGVRPEKASRAARAVRTFSTTQAVMLGITHVLAAAALVVPTRTNAIAFVALYLVTGFGISLGYHRALSHGAFRANPIVLRVLCTMGALAFQGGPLTWVSFHRAHHRFTDRHGDPHAASRGFFWSHFGWALQKGPNGYRRQKLRHLTASLERIPFFRWLERYNLAINLTLFVATWVVFGGGIALWAFPLRIVALWHVTWLTNSLAHGAHDREPTPRNIQWLALVGFGEGLHKNHHDVPSSPRFARRRGELDPGYWALASLSALRLVSIPRNHASTVDVRSEPTTPEIT
jgi:stearoyl-CoA desaturase (delta-9 desaturase)